MRTFYKEKTRLGQINESISYMESMLPMASVAVRVVLNKNIERCKKEAQSIIKKMISDGYTGE